MRKVYFKKKYYVNIKFKYKILFFFVLTILTTILFFNYVNNSITPILMKHAESELKRISLYIINESINDDILEEINIDNIYITNSENNSIKSIDFNTYLSNQLLRRINNSIWNNLNALQTGNLNNLKINKNFFTKEELNNLKKGVVYKIPLGVIYKNSLFNNLGPQIPIKLKLSGNVNSFLNTNIKNYGINNAIIEITINIEVEEQVLLPFTSKTISVTNEVPLAIKIIEGNIPDYYASGIKENSPIISSIN